MEQKKKNAFTLVELLAVIVILGLLVGIVGTSIVGSLKKNKQELYKVQINNIKEAAKGWASENVFLLPEDEQPKTIYLKDLSSFIDIDIQNPLTGNNFSKCLEITIQKEAEHNKYIYTINEKTIDNVGC